jgi:hypothetical protein
MKYMITATPSEGKFRVTITGSSAFRGMATEQVTAKECSGIVEFLNRFPAFTGTPSDWLRWNAAGWKVKKYYEWGEGRGLILAEMKIEGKVHRLWFSDCLISVRIHQKFPQRPLYLVQRNWSEDVDDEAWVNRYRVLNDSEYESKYKDNPDFTAYALTEVKE